MAAAEGMARTCAGWSGLALTKGVLVAASGAQGTRLPGRERAWPVLPHVDVTGFLPSLSLPPCVSLCCFSLSYPLRIPALAHPISVACGSWGHPPLLPCLLAWSCLLSRCLPQEVGTRRPRSPTLQERGMGAQTPGLGPIYSLRKRTPPPRGCGPVPGAPTRLSLLVCLSHALLCPRPRCPRCCACSASHPVPLPEALTLC